MTKNIAFGGSVGLLGSLFFVSLFRYQTKLFTKGLLLLGGLSSGVILGITNSNKINILLFRQLGPAYELGKISLFENELNELMDK